METIIQLPSGYFVTLNVLTNWRYIFVKVGRKTPTYRTRLFTFNIHKSYKGRRMPVLELKGYEKTIS